LNDACSKLEIKEEVKQTKQLEVQATNDAPQTLPSGMKRQYYHINKAKSVTKPRRKQ
jgi:hypothetical protein